LNPELMNMSIKRLFLLVVLIPIGLVLWSCGDGVSEHAVKADQAPVSVAVESVQVSPVDLSYEAVGTVRSRTASVVSSRVMGQIIATHVEPGDRVKAGQVLVEIDNRDAQANLASAKAGLSEAQNALQEIEESFRAAEAAKAAAEAGAGLATATYKRFEALLQRESVSPQEFEEVEFKYKAAQAELRRADQELLALEARKRQVLDRIEQARAGLKNAEIYATYTRVTAPFAGIVTAKHVEAGAMSVPGQPLVTVEDNRNYELEVSVQESRLGAIKIGDQAVVIVDALQGENMTGVVNEIVPSGDPASHSFMVKLRLPANPGLRSGMFGRARFADGRQEKISIPSNAIVQRGQLTGVMIVDDSDKARFRLVKTGKRYADRVEVLSGLEPGQRVVTQGVQQLADGSLVRVQ